MNPRTSTRQNRRYPRKGGTTHPLQWGVVIKIQSLHRTRSTDPHEPTPAPAGTDDHDTRAKYRRVRSHARPQRSTICHQDNETSNMVPHTHRSGCVVTLGPFPKRKPARQGHRRAPNTIFDAQPPGVP
ncbi:hypothetical protein BS47DRAFT_1367934 [Hydnum rufescens UP504]|uniref:Uncharacterized protein n=1 Tax=Hydnum rufescens UP504 TaxID=1448309 RepID=A0A9P6AH04_9AGAM|nr:hypothetical protein BS47DRAFT_1367934 [Hydnum rufescens UP504]